MQESVFFKLVDKYLAGEASREEELLLEEYYKRLGNQEKAFLSLEQQQALSKLMLNNILTAVNAPAVRVRPFLSSSIARFSSAAAVLIVLSFSFYYFLYNKKQILKTADTSVAVKAKAEKAQSRFINLPDGSAVILHGDSKVNYTSDFGKNGKREVTLTGEAYFDIEHDELHPFIVHTGKQKTTVLGTAFNIKAYPQEATITVTVARGRVKVGDDYRTYGVLFPNQQITYDKVKAIPVKTVVAAQNVVAWKNQDIYFDDATLGDVLNELADRFKVNFVFSNSNIKNCRLTVTFLQTQKLEQILTAISAFNNITCSQENNKTVVLSGPGCEN
jgi:ferric-dicitrate binding protein FerR (iron transport regulator)